MRCPKSALVGSVLLLTLFAQVADGQKIHVLVVSNTGDGGLGRQATIESVRALFQYLVPSSRYSIQVMEGAKQSYDADSILRTIRDIPVAREDTIVFFFHGHGGRDQRTSLGREHHFLNMPDGGRLWSADLQETMNAKPCHLRLILTASCNRSIRLPPSAMEPAMDEWAGDRDGMAPIMERLFLDHRGLLHMNGSYPGQYHFSDDGGAWFFQSLFTYIWMHPKSRPTWRSVDAAMDVAMNEKFRAAKEADPEFRRDYSDQDRLVPVAWSYPEPERGATNTTNARVLSLEAGDVILTINGERIDSRADCIDAVNRSPGTMTFTVRDRRNGTVWQMQTELRDDSPRFGVYLTDKAAAGARVTGVERGSPCTRNDVLGRAE